MSDLRKAAEMALEALEELRFANAPFLDEAMEALRTALAQKGKECIYQCIYPDCETGIGCDGPCNEKPVDETAKRKHEPVAWLIRRTGDGGAYVDGYETCEPTDYGAFPVYTAPPKREWQGLTSDNKHFLLANAWNKEQAFDDFMEAIDKFLEEKNT